MRLKDPPENAGGGLDGQRLRETGNALDQQVAAGEQAGQDPLEHLVLAGDHAPDLEEGLLQHLFRLLGLDCGVGCSDCSGTRPPSVIGSGIISEACIA